MNNLQNPYPSSKEKSYLAKKTGMTIVQLNDWFKIRRKKLKSSKIFERLPTYFSEDIKLFRNFFINNPNPNKYEKQKLAKITKKTIKQVSCWFAKERFKKKESRKKVR